MLYVWYTKIYTVGFILDEHKLTFHTSILQQLYPLCTVVYLPPNMTAIVQPMDQGVVECMQRGYRKNFDLELFVQPAVQSYTVQQFMKQWSLYSCVEINSNAWHSVHMEILCNAGKKILKENHWATNWMTLQISIGSQTDIQWHFHDGRYQQLVKSWPKPPWMESYVSWRNDKYSLGQ